MLDRVVRSVRSTCAATPLTGTSTYSNTQLGVSLTYPRRFVKTLEKEHPGKEWLLEVQFIDTEEAITTAFALFVVKSPARLDNRDSGRLRGDYYDQRRAALEGRGSTYARPPS